MTVTVSEHGTITITGEHIALARLVALKGALRLEMLGMKRRGRSAYSIIKTELGLTGSRQVVLDKLQAMLDMYLERRKKENEEAVKNG